MVSAKTSVLVELGILCRGQRITHKGTDLADLGPHTYSGHHQLSRYENPLFQYPFIDPTLPAFLHYPTELTMQDALDQTRLLVLLGAADSDALKQCLHTPNIVVLIFEPDEDAFNAFLEGIKLSILNRDGVFCFLGDPYSFNPALQDMLQGEILRHGTPAIFLTDRIRHEFADWAEEVTEYIEILHYRHAIYGITSQYRSRSIPLRAITRGLIFDQQLHAYENIQGYLTFPDISCLRDTLPGHSAILVAAGPDLNDKLDYIRRNQDRAVVISVNNALKPLAEAGIAPQFVVINDISIASGEVFKHIPEMPETILVAHCLADLGGDKFKQKYLFGNHLPEIFGEREDLDAHGSVISAAFSLAQLLGCTQCIIVGGQLASTNPWQLEYAKGTVNELKSFIFDERIDEYPQLYPVKTTFGETLYTTLNFRDAALWLTENIRLSEIKCINTCKASIIQGLGIAYQQEPELPIANVTVPTQDLPKAKTTGMEQTAVLNHLQTEINKWQIIIQAIDILPKGLDPTFLTQGMTVLGQLDQSNVTSLVERYQNFSTSFFHHQVFETDDSKRRAGLLYYFKYAREMSEHFLTLCLTIEAALKKVA